MIFSIVDMGSNSLKLSIYDEELNKEIYSQRDVIRLGQDSFMSGISKESMERVCETLKVYLAKSKEFLSQSFEVYATSAVRDAKNKDAFIDFVKRETGVDIKVLSGEEEAEIIFKAISNDIGLNERFMALDIGGGSSEIIIGERKEILYKESFPLGAVRLYDMFLKNNNETEAYERTKSYVYEVLKPSISLITGYKVKTLIGSSGTWTNLSDFINNKLDPRPFFVPNEVMDSINILLKMTVEERCCQKGIESKRADIIVAGGAIIDVILSRIFFSKIMVTKASLKEGLIERQKGKML